MALDHEDRQAIGEFVFRHSFSQARRSGVQEVEVKVEAESHGKQEDRDA
jgi:hypothetical protein